MTHAAELISDLTPAPAESTEFDRTTAVRRMETRESGDAAGFRFDADLDPTWSSLRGIHGGYQSAILVRAAQAAVAGRDVRTVTTSFLRPGSVGPAQVDITLTRHGRSLTTVHAMLRQRDKDVAVARLTMSGDVDGVSWTEPAADPPRPLAESVAFVPPSSVMHFQQAEFRIDPTTPVEFGGADDARVAGHVRPLETRDIDAPWLTMIGDWFPPSPFRRLAPPTGGVSIDYTVHIHRTLPADANLWIAGVFHTRVSNGGLAVEHGTLTTPDGDPIAETFHTRWTGAA